MTYHPSEHEEAPVDEPVSGPPADEGNAESVDPSVDATEEIDPCDIPGGLRRQAP